MIKIKRIFYFVFISIFLCFNSISLIGCSKNNLNKVSKGLSTYNITATLNEDMTINASQSFNYINSTGKELNELYFHLYPRAFRKDALIKPYTSLTMASCFSNGISYGDIEIESVKVEDKSKEIVLAGEDEDILQVDLGYLLKNKESVQINIDFKVTIPNCTHRFGYFLNNINLGNWYPILCGFKNGEFEKTPYYSTGDPFFSDIANYNVQFNYPKGYELASTGKINILENSDKISSKIVANAVRDFALNFSKNSSRIQSKVGETEVFYYGYKSDENHQKYLDISVKALDYFNKIFGKYPYSTLSVVKTPFIYGGMEYPNIVFISDAIDDEDEFLKVIVHEIAHQWWYATVGNDEVNEAWLDESISEYSTALFFLNFPEYGVDYNELVNNAVSSYTLYVDVIQTIRGEVNTKMNLSINKYQNDYEYSYMIYVKGVIMFDELKKVVGVEKVIAGLKRYYNDNKFKLASKNEFYKAFESSCHKDLGNFFEGYLNGTTIITNIS